MRTQLEPQIPEPIPYPDDPEYRYFTTNIVQSLDAELAEYLIQHMECIPIHDAFVVSIYDLGLLVDETNKFFRTKFNMNPGIKTNPFIVI